MWLHQSQIFSPLPSSFQAPSTWYDAVAEPKPNDLKICNMWPDSVNSQTFLCADRILSSIYLVETLIKDFITLPVIHFSYFTDISRFWFFKRIHFPIALLNVGSNLITCNDFLITCNWLFWSCWSCGIWKIDVPKTEVFGVSFSWMIFATSVSTSGLTSIQLFHDLR